MAETPSIAQARRALLRSYNDYRALCHLPVVRDFKHLTSDDIVRTHLSDLYGTIDNLEFYVGLFAEEAGPNNVLPPLMTAMVAFDAFSQVLTNPLVAPRVFGPQTFSKTGMRIIGRRNSIGDLVRANVPEDTDYFISLTRRDYERV
jgi:prostaglandin-endoperoxide synthase 2